MENQNNFADQFSVQEVIRLSNSPAGRQLIDLLHELGISENRAQLLFHLIQTITPSAASAVSALPGRRAAFQ